MQITGAPPWATIGALIAIIVLIIAIVFMVTGALDFKVGGLLAALAVARLL